MKHIAPMLSLMVLFYCMQAMAQRGLPALPTLPSAGVLPQPAALTISHESSPEQPFSVIGPRGALLGQQDGGFEAWIFPWKVFSGLKITANMQDYPVPIDVNEHAASIDVRPDSTTITYSHANFTIRQIMFAPKETPEGSGVLVLYQIEAVRPMTLTFSLTPVMDRMWPALSDSPPSPEWVRTAGGSGFYILHENLPGNAAALAMPRAEPGILAPYQERASFWPLQFVLHFDPKTDAHTLFPLLIAVGNSDAATTHQAFAKSLAELDSLAASQVQANEAYYAKLLSTSTGIETPDAQLNAAFSWAEASIDQLRIRTLTQREPDGKEEALTAGFVGSGDSARPGFGWFFGRDSLWTLYAMDSCGDFSVTRQEVEFLLERQRADGKIMHEWSQTASLVDWHALPYEYAAADSTPLLQMAMADYLKISGDADFVRTHWNELLKAWRFETAHVSDDGIYNNSQGTGWVESWVPSMPHQEIYLALLDEEASTAFAELAQVTGHADEAQQARERAGRLRSAIEKEYYVPSESFYAFSRNPDGSTDNTATIFPSVAWWDGNAALEHPDAMMSRWASGEFSTDWGTRILSDRVSFYDPISYHQGTVWPLYTGWVSVAEYRAGRTLAGYAHLMQNAEMTWAQDLGNVTELLSGQFYQPLGRSTAHQLWSSAMVISPVLRGMFGLEWNAGEHTLMVAPHLPAEWKTVTVRRVPLGGSRFDLTFTRRGAEMVVEASRSGEVRLASHVPGAKAEGRTLRIPLPAVEAGLRQKLPEPGAETQEMKVLDQQSSGRTLTLTLAAQGGSRQVLDLRENAPKLTLRTDDAEMGVVSDGLRTMAVTFPPGDGYVTKTVTVRW
ncbi:amylo-alpha-1,6-glucosidase [Paracidobacterium acidisoli]|uniref:Glycogen debranching protein n=1 Tax=Paracidobacterium acidisoli TaxID=2303751 RepID=A0A372IML7_9BACT|nr:amylo-alpha-1,6-glucosidase [Paracidobacterium acidisoli]MBT9331612.1 hypothetical protein [Paracidobacterium acidisoli]